MYNLNVVVIEGNLTRDPDVIPGKNVVKFSVACNEGEKTHFINCVAFEKTADFIERYLTKGSKITVEGRLDYQSWEKDGIKKTALQVRANRVYSTKSAE